MAFWERNYWMGYYDPDGAHYVLASTGSCDPGDGAFALLQEYDLAAPSWTRRELSLDAYAGQTLCLAFNYRGVYSAEWYIDDVEVTYPVSGGVLEFHNLTVAGSGAPPAFGGDVSVGADLTVVAGSTLDVSGVGLTVEGALLNNGSLRQTRNVGADQAVPFLHVSDGSGGYSYRGLELTDTSGAGLGATTVTIMGNQVCPDPPGFGDLIERCYEIEPTAPNAATLRLYYLTTELNGNDPGALYIFRDAGDAWEAEMGAYSREANGGDYDWVEVAGVDEYSPFAAADEDPTAAVIVDFAAVPRWDGVRLTWETGSELTLVGFNLFRSLVVEGPYEQINPTLIPAEHPGSVEGDTYSWRDVGVSGGTDYYYRLETVLQGGGAASYGPVSATVPHAAFLPLSVR
jgi:hypothetical protein